MFYSPPCICLLSVAMAIAGSLLAYYYFINAAIYGSISNDVIVTWSSLHQIQWQYRVEGWTYRIMQIVRSGKVLRLHDLLVIHGKTFAIVQQFKTPYNKKEKNSLENLHDWRLIRENRESFPPRTICIIQYMSNMILLSSNWDKPHHMRSTVKSVFLVHCLFDTSSLIWLKAI